MDKSYKRKNNYSKPNRGGSFENWSSYSRNNKRKFKNYLEIGMKGFLCTCNARERDCVREAYNILNEYADKLFGSENPINAEGPLVEAEGSGDQAVDGDIEDELKKEVSNLKSDKKRNFERFNTVDTGVKSKIFIKTNIEDPVQLAYTILSDIAETKAQKSRFLLRIVPVEVTCKANLEDIKAAAEALFEKHFKCEPTTFAVVVQIKYNDKLVKDELIHSLAALVTDRNRDHKANLKEAKHTVLADIMKGICCLSVLEDYKKLRHYNIAELAKPEETVEGEPSEETEEKVEDEVEGDDDSQKDEAEDTEEISETAEKEQSTPVP